MYKTNIKPNWMNQNNLTSYKLTLYLVNKRLWNMPDPLANDSAPVQNGEAVIIAETGATTVFSIDNVNMTTFVRGGQKNVEGSTGVIQFQMQEVLGFNLLDKLLALSGQFGFSTIASARYVMKIEFVGRDPESDTRVVYPNMFMYSLTFQEIQASVGAEGTSYDIIALNNQRMAKYQSSVYQDINVENFTTVDDFITALQAACNKYENDIGTVGQANPQPRKKWIIELGPTLKGIKSRGQVDGGGPPNLQRVAGIPLGQSPMQGTGDSGSATKMTANPDGSRTVPINPNTNIADYVEVMLTKNSPLFGEYAAQKRAEIGTTPIIKSSTKIRLLERDDPKTNTSEMEIKIVVDLYNDTAQVSTNSADQEKHITLKQNQQSYTESVSEQVVKKYNWLYTGQNTEVLQFDLNVNNAFFVAQDPNAGAFLPEASGMKTTSQLQKTTIRPAQQAFLSQTELVQQPIERPVYGTDATGSKVQNTGEDVSHAKGTDAMADRNMSRREEDFLNMTLEIRGDPFWMGNGTTVLGTEVKLMDVQNSTVYIGFVTYKPEETVTYLEGQRRGDMDTAASGLYEVFKVDQKLSQGQFTQTLHTMRNRNFSTYLMQTELEMM